jgi:hypothetical protein
MINSNLSVTGYMRLSNPLYDYLNVDAFKNEIDISFKQNGKTLFQAEIENEGDLSLTKNDDRDDHMIIPHMHMTLKTDESAIGQMHSMVKKILMENPLALNEEALSEEPSLRRIKDKKKKITCKITQKRICKFNIKFVKF